MAEKASVLPKMENILDVSFFSVASFFSQGEEDCNDPDGCGSDNDEGGEWLVSGSETAILLVMQGYLHIIYFTAEIQTGVL